MNKYDKIVNFRVDVDTWKILQFYCTKYDLGLSSVLRCMVDYYVKHNKI